MSFIFSKQIYSGVSNKLSTVFGNNISGSDDYNILLYFSLVHGNNNITVFVPNYSSVSQKKYPTCL